MAIRPKSTGRSPDGAAGSDRRARRPSNRVVDRRRQSSVAARLASNSVPNSGVASDGGHVARRTISDESARTGARDSTRRASPVSAPGERVLLARVVRADEHVRPDARLGPVAEPRPRPRDALARPRPTARSAASQPYAPSGTSTRTASSSASSRARYGAQLSRSDGSRLVRRRCAPDRGRDVGVAQLQPVTDARPSAGSRAPPRAARRTGSRRTRRR